MLNKSNSQKNFERFAKTGNINDYIVYAVEKNEYAKEFADIKPNAKIKKTGENSGINERTRRQN